MYAKIKSNYNACVTPVVIYKRAHKHIDSYLLAIIALQIALALCSAAPALRQAAR